MSLADQIQSARRSMATWPKWLIPEYAMTNMPPLLLDWLRDPVANECPYNAQQLRDVAHDEIVRLQTERLGLQIERDKLLDRIGVLERRIEAKEILSSSRGGE